MTNSYLIGYHFLASYNTIEGWILRTSQNHRLIPSPSQWSSANPRNREQRRPCTETFMHFSPGRATKFSPHTLLIFTLPQLLSKCMATGAYRAKNPLGGNMHTKWNIKQNFIRHVYHLISPPRSFTLFLPVRELLEDIILLSQNSREPLPQTPASHHFSKQDRVNYIKLIIQPQEVWKKIM